MLHVMHYVPNFHHATGGREIFVCGLMSHLQKFDVKQTIITNNSLSSRKEITLLNNRSSVIALPVRKFGAYSILNDLYNNMKEDYDIINIHGYGEYAGDLACLLKMLRRLKKPLVLTTHGIAGLKHAYMAFDFSSSFTPSQRIARSLHIIYDFTMGRLEMNIFDKVVILSEEERLYLSRIGLGLRKSLKIPIAINDFFFDTRVVEERKYILYVGRIDRYKGLNVLAKAIKELRMQNLNLKCIIIGKDYGYKHELQSLINNLEISDLISIVDYTSQRDLLNYYYSAIVTILPSSSEGFPLVLAESMATGTPFIATPVGAIPELVEQSKAGLLTPIGEPRALAQQIIKIAKDPSLWASLSLAGKEFSLNFKWEVIAKRYYETYLELVN